MKKSIMALLLAVIPLTSGFILSPTAKAYSDFCPTSNSLNGWWGTITPSNRLCGTDYYTWNTISGLSGEESSMKSTAFYIMCGLSSLHSPVYGAERAYIPAPDSQQTHSAHYYWWQSSSSYALIGSVNQYGTTGWATLVPETWNMTDNFKLSDNTNETTKYSKHVDLDEYSLSCS